MAKAPKKDPRKGDRHKGTRMMRISERLASVLDDLGHRNATSGPAEANRLIREGLERIGMWPPSDVAHIGKSPPADA